MTALFSLVVPVYDVERYLPEFLDSLARQTYPVADLEIVFVDDGSRDSSAELIATWIDAVAPAATLVRKTNGGLASARNAGLGRVAGTWVTFCDPDDTLAPDYFAAVARFLAAHDSSETHLVACRLLMLDERTGELTDTHPLRHRFATGNRVVDLDDHPEFVHLSAASGFYRRELIDQELHFDARIRPNFEDGHFTGRYLAGQPRPRVAFVRDAVYRYRRRADGSSLVQDSWSQPAKFTDIPRYGHLDLLQRVDAARGSVPVWLQNLVLYDLLWYFKYDERALSPLGSVPDASAAAFHDVLPRTMRYIDTATIEQYRVSVASADIRTALIVGAKGERRRPERVRIVRIDAEQRLAEIRYFFGGGMPLEEFRRLGLPVAPIYGKSRSLSFVGKQLASERIAWLPADGTLTASLDGRDVAIQVGDDPDARFAVDPARHWRRLAATPAPNPSDDAPRPGRRVGATGRTQLARALRRHAGRLRRGIVRAAVLVSAGRRRWRYRNAWVFIDHMRLAQDNAEHLYRHVTTHHREINAWFVLERDTADWRRLAGEGFRLVRPGTPDHRLLMLNCTELISSQLDEHVAEPIDRRRYGRGTWRLTFLQHGVTNDDLSRSFNRYPLSRLITATEQEHRSIAGDQTPYVFTGKEVVLTGLPRHDRLLRVAADQSGVATDRLLLVMPTWRRDLVEVLPAGGDLGLRARLADSRFAKHWIDLLRSDRLAELAAQAGLRVSFLPHPNMSALCSEWSLPASVDVHRYEDVDLQEIFARSAMMITDYSSNVVEAAYLQRPVIYFQFDRAEFFSGQHGRRRGQWSDDHDGFGPVVERASDVLDELEHLVNVGVTPQHPYATRMAEAFAFRDGKSCERVFDSIVAARRPPALSRRTPRR